MAEFTKHLYLILFPNEALVASQLTPEEFGMHYSIGSPRHFSGKVIFVEVDIEFRRFELDQGSIRCAKDMVHGIYRQKRLDAFGYLLLDYNFKDRVNKKHANGKAGAPDQDSQHHGKKQVRHNFHEITKKEYHLAEKDMGIDRCRIA